MDGRRLTLQNVHNNHILNYWFTLPAQIGRMILDRLGYFRSTAVKVCRFFQEDTAPNENSFISDLLSEAAWRGLTAEDLWLCSKVKNPTAVISIA